MHVPALIGALRERRFRLLWLGQSTSALGDALVPVALAFAVLGLPGGSASDLGFVFAAQVLPLVAFIIAGGVWADRLPRQLVMLASDVVRGGVHATIAVLLLTGSAELWHLVCLMAVYGTAEAFFRPAQTGLTPSTVGAEHLQQANALLGFSASSANVLGPVLAGVIVTFGSPGLAFALDAGTFAVSATSLALLRMVPPAVDTVLVACGGGGLVSGIAVAVKALRPEARVVAVEPERSTALRSGLEAGGPVPVTPDSISDGLSAPFAGKHAVALCTALGVESMLVSEVEIEEAFRFLYLRAKLACEPAAAAALAPLLAGRADGGTTVVVVSGGNVSPQTASAILARA